MLLPLPETRLFQLDLLGEAFSQHLLLLFVFGVVNLSDFWLSEFTRLHLGETVRFVVGFFRRGDEVEHVGSDEQAAKLLEVAVLLVFNCRSA